jgi:hypothetical protein
MKLIVQSGATSVKQQIFIQDSTSANGSGLTGLVFNSTGLTAYYFRDGDTASTQIALATAAVGTFTSGGFIAVDSTNLPGVYEIGVPNAFFSNNVRSGIIMLKGATNMVPVLLEFQIVPWNPQDSVRLGLTALPNIAQGSAGAISTGDSTGRVTLTPAEHANIATDVLDGTTIDTSIGGVAQSVRQSLRLMVAALAGQVSGAAGVSVTIKDTSTHAQMSETTSPTRMPTIGDCP